MKTSFECSGVPLVRPDFSTGFHRAASSWLLLDVRPETLEPAIELLAQHGALNNHFSGLHITGLDDLEFLRDYPLLLYLVGEELSPKALQSVESLSNLRGLRLNAPKGGVDLTCFPNLEEFIGDWHRGNSGIGDCGELRTLRAWGFRSTEPDLSALAKCARLERLWLVRPGIKSIEGIESLEDLRYLDLAYAPKIESLTPLAAPTVDLRELSLANMKAITDYSPLASIRKLRRLSIFKCAPMEDLAWTKGMDYLDSIGFVETKVLNGDLSPLLSLPLLRYVGAGNKKHYSHTDEELNALLDESIGE